MSYSAPTTLADALDLVGQGPCKLIAGGTDVYPAMGQGQVPPAFLDVTRIAGFKDIAHGAEGTRFGAAVTWTDVIRADLPPAFDALKAAAREVGSIQIQNAGTLAGNICNASPAADGMPPLLALDAQVEIASRAGTRQMPLSAFVTGVRQTALAPGELVTALLIPPQPAGSTSAFEKLGSRKHLVISIVMTAANIALDEAGRISHAALAVGSCSATAQRLTALEADLIGTRPGDLTITPDHLAPLAPIDDVRGSAAYRLEAAAEHCTRAIQRAAAP